MPMSMAPVSTVQQPIPADGMATFASMQTYGQGALMNALPVGALPVVPPVQPQVDTSPLILSTSPLAK